MTRLGLLLVCSLTFMLSEVTAAPQPFPSSNDFEVETNMTIDEILARENQVPQGMSLDPNEDGLILTELDMLLTPEQYQLLYGEGEKRVKRKAYTGAPLWPNAQLVYTISQEFSSKDRYNIEKAMTDIEFYTCVSFRERTTETNYVYFRNKYGCSSVLGMVGGRQYLNLRSPGCNSRGLQIHEILHALGVFHEHQRSDRDKYVNIYKQNIHQSLHYNFNKFSTRVSNLMGTEYDFASIMHYGTKAFSMNGQHTLYPKDPAKAKYITRIYRNGLGYTDVKLLNLMYKCASHCPNKDKCTEDGHLDQNCNCICKDGSQECDTTKKTETDQTWHNSYFNSWTCYRWAAEGRCVTERDWMRGHCAKACESYNNGPCYNLDKDEAWCRLWAVGGHCHTNPDWMLPNCARACGKCPSTENCKNIYSDEKKCYKWAYEGECANNPHWMLPNCAKACGKCPSTENCKNIHSDEKECYKWAYEGECATNPHWMLPNCAKACGKCLDTTDDPLKGVCQDVYRKNRCTRWKARGECVTNPELMYKACRKTCNLCEGIYARRPENSCSNSHQDDKSCDRWAKEGECQINPGWMPDNCQKSCLTCQ